MTAVAIRPEELKKNIAAALGAKARQVTLALDEVTVTVAAADYLESMRILRDSNLHASESRKIRMDSR